MTAKFLMNPISIGLLTTFSWIPEGIFSGIQHIKPPIDLSNLSPRRKPRIWVIKGNEC